jgi:hypothetical protein
MNQGRSLKSMVFMINAVVNMEIQTCGNVLLNYSISYL